MIRLAIIICTGMLALIGCQTIGGLANYARISDDELCRSVLRGAQSNDVYLGRRGPGEVGEATRRGLSPTRCAELTNRKLDTGTPSTVHLADMLSTESLAKPIPKREQALRTDMLPRSTSELPDLGGFHALIIGNNDYRSLPRLRTAVRDAQAVATLLKSQYGFNTNILTNASRAEIIQALEGLRRKLTERDNLLIYYAGHGQLDRGADRGYWLPVDATEDSQVNWLSNATITDAIKAIQAKHVMVVADSCYSGALTRGVRGIEVRPRSPGYVARTNAKKSRTVLASGGLEPVSDSGGSGHSIFANAFLEALQSNRDVIDGTDVFVYVRKQVRINADQVPNYANIRYAGHEVGGDFLFVRRSGRKPISPAFSKRP